MRPARCAEPALPFHQSAEQFGINMLALDKGRPRQMGLKELLVCFVEFREEVILRRGAV